MKFENIFEQAKARLNRYRGHVLASLGAVAVCGSIFYLQATVTPGMISYLASLPALAIILITVLARLDDINLSQKSRNWQLRRLGLIMVGLGTFQLVLAPFGEHPKFPSWIGVMLAWGVALTWFTTPKMPPWWKYVTGEKDDERSEQSTK